MLKARVNLVFFIERIGGKTTGGGGSYTNVYTIFANNDVNG